MISLYFAYSSNSTAPAHLGDILELPALYRSSYHVFTRRGHEMRCSTINLKARCHEDPHLQLSDTFYSYVFEGSALSFTNLSVPIGIRYLV